MNTIATKLQVGAAALAVTTAAMMPVAAQAAPNISSVPMAPVTQVLDDISLAPAALNNIPQVNFWWFGAPNPAPPPKLNLLSTHLLDGLVGWFGPWEICILGVGLGWDPYTGLSLSLGFGC